MAILICLKIELVIQGVVANDKLCKLDRGWSVLLRLVVVVFCFKAKLSYKETVAPAKDMYFFNYSVLRLA